MSITFTRAPTFVQGAEITAAEHIQLADAFNDRLRSGIGDPTQRIHLYQLGLWRQVRTNDDTLWPAQGEWSEFYAHIAGDGEDHYRWPLVPPGEAGGRNPANPAMAFVAGDGATQFGEGARISEQLDFDSGDGTPRSIWEMGKRQRGAYDPTAQVYGAPFLYASESVFRIVSQPWSSHGKSYGGYLPVPESLGNCITPSGQTFPNRDIFFTNLSTLGQKHFTGTCGPDYGGSGTDVSAIWDGPFAYYVYKWDGSFERLAKDEWIEGPYTGGGDLKKPQGDQLPRLMLNPFIKEFRGVDSQRTGEFDITEIAFSMEEFLNAQFQLAPNIGHEDAGYVIPDYPAWEFTGGTTIAAGTTGTAHQFATGFVLGAVIVEAEQLVGSATVEILDGSTVVSTVALEADDFGKDGQIVVFDTSATPNLNVRLATVANFTTAAGWIRVEASELQEYKPQLHDAYMLLRCASALRSPEGLDTRGIDEEQAKDIFTNYNANACIINHQGALGVDQDTEYVNTNPVYDAARRYCRSWSRVVNRHALTGYEVDSEGRSVLWFNATTPTGGGTLFDGIVDAIAADAPALGESNEWLMFACFKRYGPDGAIFDSDSYTDYFPFIDRCSLYSSRMSVVVNRDLLLFAQGVPPTDSSVEWASPPISPELVTGYRYAGTPSINGLEGFDDATRIAFYRSCQMYQPDYEIESAVTVGGQVKITFKTRFQHTDDAPGTIENNAASWDEAALKAQTYRTDENGIMEYLHHIGTGSTPSTKLGDECSNSTMSSSFSVFGAVYPQFFFTKLIPKPYEETPANSTVEKSHDTIITADRFQQMETYLRAMCEGYIDGQTTVNRGCQGITAASSAYDFTFENLCFEAFGGRWINTIAPEVRTDMPYGFGPSPNVLIYAEVLNQFSACLNLLDKARVMLPWKLQSWANVYHGTGTVAATWPSGASDCQGAGPGTANKAIAFGASAPNAGTWVGGDGDWQDVAPSTHTGEYGVGVGASASWTACSGSAFVVTNETTITSYRLTPVDPLATYAFPPGMLALYNAQTVGFYARVTDTSGTFEAESVALADASDCRVPGDHFWSDGSTHYRLNPIVTESNYCQLLSSGTLEPPGLQSSDMAFGYDSPTTCYSGPSSVRSFATSNISTGVLTVPIV